MAAVNRTQLAKSSCIVQGGFEHFISIVNSLSTTDCFHNGIIKIEKKVTLMKEANRRHLVENVYS